MITKRSPGTDDADAAFAVLVSYAIRSGRIDQAEKMVAQASEQSKPRLELQLGSAMWVKYLEMSQPGQPTPPDDAALAKLKAPALKFLQSGFDSLKKEGAASELLATAGLYLAQALLSDGKYLEAISVLEDEQAGPLKLIANNNPLATKPPYMIEAYKTALRAYVSVSPPQEDKAVDTIQALDKVVRASTEAAQASEQMNRIYIAMGVALQKQLEDLKAAGNDKEAQRVAVAFAKFIDRISAQSGSGNWATRVWLAQTYFALANDHKPSDSESNASKPLGAAAKAYFIKSRDTYQALIKEAEGDPKLPPSDGAVLAAKMQLGECYRALGEFDKAIESFADILKQKGASLAVQRAAAKTYEQRGEKEDVKYFENAIHGGLPTKPGGPNLVWGWVRISTETARAARSDKTFRDSFFDARLNIAQCRYKAAMKKEGKARQDDLLNAKLGIQSLSRVYPDYGGEKWKPQFEAILKDIKTAEDGAAKKESS